MDPVDCLWAPVAALLAGCLAALAWGAACALLAIPF